MSAIANAEPVSLWWVALDAAQPGAGEPEADLTPPERRRADDFLRPLDRRRFVAARGALRRLLAGELGCAADAVPLVADSRGKPGLAGTELKLSASRSAGVALFALSWTLEVGVDVEAIREGVDIDRIAAKFFSAAERRALAALPARQRRAAAFQCWTRKEAYAKGTGEGLASSLGATDVGIGARSAIGSGWSVHQVDLAPGLAAAVAGSAAAGWSPQAPRRLETRAAPQPCG